MKLLNPFFLILSTHLLAQTPQVPHKLHFAGMTLTVRDDARREIQKDVDAMTQSPRHFNIKVERAKTYFPIIEKIFEEEGVPVDFKYLVLQESALIPDAVSVSNAVGFWQFKDFTAVEMGLRVDRDIDERMNIVSATRAAARYLKKNNLHFNNWLYALQAYQMGAGGVMQSVKDFNEGASHMDITSKTYWYVKKYLAHKIAYEDAVNGPGQLKVIAYESTGKQTLKDIAKDVNVDESEIISYNKWLRSKTIPGDKAYAVIVPVMDGSTIASSTPSYIASSKPSSSLAEDRANEKRVKPVAETLRINGIAAIKAKPGESSSVLARRAGTDLNYFLKCNDMTLIDRVRPGEYYFTAKKRSRAEEAYHKVSEGEDLWIISQHYGVKLKKLRRFNRLNENTRLRQGTVIYLSSRKPRNSSEPVVETEILKLDEQNTFSWDVKPSATSGPPVETNSIDKTTSIDSGQVGSHVDGSLHANGNESVASQDPVASEVVLPVDSSGDAGKENTVLTATQHTVKAGETLYGIAKQYGLGVMEIVEFNQLNIQDGIKPGQVLLLKSDSATASARSDSKEIVHEVRASDTLYGVARKYGVTIQELMEWNNKTDFTISIGEKLKVIQKTSN